MEIFGIPHVVDARDVRTGDIALLHRWRLRMRQARIHHGPENDHRCPNSDRLTPGEHHHAI